MHSCKVTCGSTMGVNHCPLRMIAFALLWLLPCSHVSLAAFKRRYVSEPEGGTMVDPPFHPSGMFQPKDGEHHYSILLLKLHIIVCTVRSRVCPPCHFCDKGQMDDGFNHAGLGPNRVYSTFSAAWRSTAQLYGRICGCALNSTALHHRSCYAPWTRHHGGFRARARALRVSVPERGAAACPSDLSQGNKRCTHVHTTVRVER